MGEHEIRTLDSKVVYENRWMRVREDSILRSNGKPGIYGVVEKPDFVVVVPVTSDGKLVLVEQYRYPVQARYWEFPQGSWETNPDADPIQVANGELREETGYTAGDMIKIGELFLAYGYSSQRYHLLLAKDLIPGTTALEPEEHGLISKAFSLAEVEAMIANGTILDATTVAALGLLRIKGCL